MESIQKQYTDEMKKKFGGYYATWTPDSTVKLGDIGTLSNKVFNHIGHLEDTFGITFAIEPDFTPTDLSYSSKSNVQVTAKLAGKVAPVATVLKDADAGIIVEFGKSKSVLFEAKKVTAPRIKDLITLKNQIFDLIKQSKWDKNWVIVTEVKEAESATILISQSNNAKIELKATANIGASALNIADVSLGLQIQSSKGLDTTIIAGNGLTPLFKLMGVKKNPISSKAVLQERCKLQDNVAGQPDKFILEELVAVVGDDWNGNI